MELARKLWERGQEPFEAIPSGYTRELSDAQRSELDECLRNFNLGFLLGVLFEFTEVHVKQITGEAQKSFEYVESTVYFRAHVEVKIATRRATFKLRELGLISHVFVLHCYTNIHRYTWTQRYTHSYTYVKLVAFCSACITVNCSFI